MNKCNKCMRICIFVLSLLLVTVFLPVTVEAAGSVTVNVSKTFIRKAMEEGAPIVATALKGNSYSVVSTKQEGDLLWYEVLLRDGETKGYIRGDLVVFDAEGKVENNNTAVNDADDLLENITRVEPVKAKANTDVRVRAGASTNTSIIETIARRTEVTVDYYKLGTDGINWYHVVFDYNGEPVSGFIRSDLVTLLGNLTVVEAEPEPEEVFDEPVGESVPNQEEEKTDITETLEKEPVEENGKNETVVQKTEDVSSEKNEEAAFNVWAVVSVVELVIILALVAALVLKGKMPLKKKRPETNDLVFERLE